MEFLAFFWLFGVTVILPITVTFLSINYKREARRLREMARHSLPDAVIAQDELKDLLLDVAEEASAPLHERIRAIEQAYGLSPSNPRVSEPSRTIGRAG